METLIQMILPSAVVPALLSAWVWWFNQYKSIVLWALPVIWFPSFVWLIGWPSVIPAEANHWLYPLAVFSVLISLYIKTRLNLISVLQTLLLALVLIAISWPVLQYQFNWMLLFELLAVIVAGFVLFNFSVKRQAKTPALIMAVSSGGMGLVVALGGSLLIGQLAGALASILITLAVVELMTKMQNPAAALSSFVPVMQLYFGILIIARIYAEIPLGPSALLLMAPLAGLMSAKRYALGFSAACVIVALSLLLLATDSSNYY